MIKKNPCKRTIVGLTGSFGSGKTTVAMVFKSYGAKIIDADRIAHRLIMPGSEIYKRIINAFGNGILKKNKSIDRDKLAGIVFDNKNLLVILNKILHPEIIRIIKNQIKISANKFIVIDAPLLIETGLQRLVDKIIVVKINRDKQINRIKNKMALNKADILKRIGQQVSLSKKIRLADFVIDNNGTINKTKKQVIKIWNQFLPAGRQAQTLRYNLCHSHEFHKLCAH